jgi:4-hydroxy-2-oxoglutarate aldolase
MHLPLTTPFTADGRLNLRKLEQNVAHYSLTPAAGMVLLGPTGEAACLSDVETHEVLAAAVKSASATKVMIAGVSRASVRATLSLIEDAASMAYDAALLKLPFGFPEKELRVYLQSVADRSALPLVLADDVSLDLLIEMASHPQVLGWLSGAAGPEQVRAVLDRTTDVKRTVTVTQVFAPVTGRMAPVTPSGQATGLLSAESLIGGGSAVLAAPPKAAIKTRTKVVGFQILMGRTEGMLAGLLAGAVGSVPPFAAAAPQGCYEVLAAWKDGDPALADEKQVRLIEAVRRIEGVLGIAGLKYGCDLNGYFGGLPRLPRLPLTGMDRAEIENLMAALRS